MRKEKVIMMGGRSVGKSSLLAAIFDQSDEILSETELSISAEPSTFYPLNEKKGLLKDAFKGNESKIEIKGKGDLKISE